MGGSYGITNFPKSEKRSRRRESEGDVTMEERHNRCNVISFEDVGRGLLEAINCRVTNLPLELSGRTTTPLTAIFVQ